MARVIERLGIEIQRGNSFAKALALQPKVFDDLLVTSASVGQESGRLPEVLAHLAHHLEKINALKRKFIQALSYPALVISVATLAVTFLLAFIVPTFAEMFKNFRVELPYSTRFVLSLGDGLTTYGSYMLVVLAVVITLSWRAMHSAAGLQRIESCALRLPLVGDIILKNYVARFCRTLGTLLQAQVSLVEALEVAQRIISNAEMRREIQLILRQVKQGRAVADPVVESKLFPPMVSQMIAVGEETSELDAMLLKVADHFEKEIDSRVETLSSVMEPILILFLGVLVAGVLISMYLPIFDLVNVVGSNQ